MTYNEIIKALECCVWARSLSDCLKSGCPARKREGCSYYLRTDEDFEGVIFAELIKDALNLINRQKAEIERLHSFGTYRHCRAEAIKEFAERLKYSLFSVSKTIDGHYVHHITGDEIDFLVKEMVGDDNG